MSTAARIDDGTRSIATMTWIATAAATVILFALLAATHTRLALPVFGCVAVATALLISLHLFYAAVRPDPYIAPLVAAVAALIWGGALAALIGMTAPRTGTPLIDAELARADAVLDLSTPGLVAFVADHPPLGMFLNWVYFTAVPLSFVTPIVLALRRQEQRMWQFCFCFVTGAALAATISAAIPSLGAFVYYHVPAALAAHLPPGAGVYYLPILESYRYGGADIVDLGHVDGVVNFPSFHAVMAINIAYAFRGNRLLRTAAWLWSALITLSAIPIGGHYTIDLIAGFALWAAILQLTRLRFRLPSILPAGTRLPLFPRPEPQRGSTA